MPCVDDDVLIAEPDLKRVFVALNGPTNGAIAERHIGPDDPAKQAGHDRAAKDRFHGGCLYRGLPGSQRAMIQKRPA